MSRLSVLLVAAGFAVPVRSAPSLSEELSFEIANDRDGFVYRVGETATFDVRISHLDGSRVEQGKVVAALDNFGPRQVASAVWDLAKTNAFSLTGSLDEPGFLRLTLAVGSETQRVWSVAFDPTRIRKGSPRPADFDAYWEEARAKLDREVPEGVRLERVPELGTQSFDYFRLSCATFGRRVFGYMSVPTDRTAAPYPVQIEVSAAGFGDWTNTMSGSADRIMVFFSVYPWAPHWDWRKLGLKAAYDYMERAHVAEYGPGARYSTSGIAKGREDYFYYPVILGIDRAVDWVLRRSDVDRSRVWYLGTSQGGGFGLILAGLRNRFTKAAFCVPAITDTLGCLRGRQSGWPYLLEKQLPQNRAETERWAPYFDAANFAARIACPVRVVVGFSDVTCAPCAVYAAYNEIRADDRLIAHGFGMGHSCYKRYYDAAETWFTEKQVAWTEASVSCDAAFERLLDRTLAEKTQAVALRVKPQADILKLIDVIFEKKAYDWVGFKDEDYVRLCRAKRRAFTIPVFWIRPKGFDVSDTIAKGTSHGFECVVIDRTDAGPTTLARLKSAGLEVRIREE